MGLNVSGSWYRLASDPKTIKINMAGTASDAYYYVGIRYEGQATNEISWSKANPNWAYGNTVSVSTSTKYDVSNLGSGSTSRWFEERQQPATGGSKKVAADTKTINYLAARFAIEFDGNSGEVELPSMTAIYGETYENGFKPFTGDTFESGITYYERGWPTDSHENNRNAYMYSFSVTKDSSKKSGKTYYVKVGTIPTPKRSGYKFLGWFTEAEGGEFIDVSKACSLSDNATLYAQWELQTVFRLVQNGRMTMANQAFIRENNETRQAISLYIRENGVTRQGV